MRSRTASATPLTVVPVPAMGAEDVLVGSDGMVYTGTEEGSIFRIRPDGNRIDRVVNTGGRPLGLEELPNGRLLVCDAHRGLLAVDVATGRVEELLTHVEGRRMRFCNNAAVAENGDIYFSDSSRVHSVEQWKDDMVQNTCSGRLLVRRTDGSVEVLLDGLRFANGVALSSDESFVAVAETHGRTVVRLWLASERKGERDLLARDLPGYPDNIARGSDGLIWVTIASPRDPLVERIMQGPMFLRRAVPRIPEALQPKPRRTVRVMAFDDDGRVVHDRSADASAYHMATGVREHDGRIWVGSLLEPAVAVFEV